MEFMKRDLISNELCRINAAVLAVLDNFNIAVLQAVFMCG
jgi:hypothetical protein